MHVTYARIVPGDATQRQKAPTAAAPASVIVPTVGRPGPLRAALQSLTACSPPPAEVIVVDQSHGGEVALVVEEFADTGIRAVTCSGRGIGLAINHGLRVAGNDLVFVTNDDCTVAHDWLAVGTAAMAERPEGIVTGAVLPAGDPDTVPSLQESLQPHDYTGEVECSALYGANMAGSRKALLDLGGFDERIVPSAEDNDLCYRWLKEKRPLRYLPELRIWHHDWRSPEQMRQVYLSYGAGQGIFYAKHLRKGDLAVLRFLKRDLSWFADEIRASIRGRRRPAAQVAGTMAGLPRGLLRGLVGRPAVPRRPV